MGTRMRAINILAGLTGVVAVAMLVLASHALRATLAPDDVERIRMAAYLQLFSACAGLALANRSGRLNAIGAFLILGGASLFALALYTLAIVGTAALIMLAPVGGISMIAGWVVVAFAKPSVANG